MSRGDRIGPRGAGNGIGRGRGYYRISHIPGIADQPTGRGRGRGWKRRFQGAGQTGQVQSVAPTPEENLQTLKTEADRVKGMLEVIQKQIEDLENLLK